MAIQLSALLLYLMTEGRVLTLPISVQSDVLQFKQSRLLGFEIARGIAAYLVFWIHADIGQLDHWITVFPSVWVRDQRTFSLAHPMPPVKMFLMISGYVLTVGYFRSGEKMIIVSRLVKRYPRLIGLIVFGTVFGGVVSSIHNNTVSHSATVSMHNSQHAATHYHDQFSYILLMLKAAFVTTFQGWNDFNGVFWVMKFEVVGAYVVLLLAPIVKRIGDRSKSKLQTTNGTNVTLSECFLPTFIQEKVADCWINLGLTTCACALAFWGAAQLSAVGASFKPLLTILLVVRIS